VRSRSVGGLPAVAAAAAMVSAGTAARTVAATPSDNGFPRRNRKARTGPTQAGDFDALSRVPHGEPRWSPSRDSGQQPGGGTAAANPATAPTVSSFSPTSGTIGNTGSGATAAGRGLVLGALALADAALVTGLVLALVVLARFALRLVITERAVAKHTASIFLRLGLHTSDDDNRRVLAVLAYLGK
jgi:hypothetical protein